MTLERLGSALLITAACAGIVVSAQGRGATPAAPQGRGAAQAPASPPQGRGADPDIPEALAQVAMPWPPIHIYLRGGLKSHGKMLLIDDRLAVVGGLAIAPLSLDFRREVAIVVEEPDAVAAVVQWFRALDVVATDGGPAPTNAKGVPV